MLYFVGIFKSKCSNEIETDENSLALINQNFINNDQKLHGIKDDSIN